MGKAPKASKAAAQKMRHDGPLHQQILSDAAGGGAPSAPLIPGATQKQQQQQQRRAGWKKGGLDQRIRPRGGRGGNAAGEGKARKPTAAEEAERRRREDLADDGEEREALVDAKTSRKILLLARKQQVEAEGEQDDEEEEAGGVDGDVDMAGGAATTQPGRRAKEAVVAGGKAAAMAKAMLAARPAVSAGVLVKADEDGDDDDDDDGEEEEEVEEWDADAAYEDELEIDEGDAALIDKFMANEPRQQGTLADMIMAKIAASEAASERTTAAAAAADGDDDAPGGRGAYKDGRMHPARAAQPRLDPKIVEVYRKVGLLLSRYRSGKLPKAFKLIPALPNWEEVLDLTQPMSWSPQATFQATRIFVSNLPGKLAYRFCSDFLLDRVRDDIAETKKLNYHHYMALKKALFKPSAFFKGILFPLCESGNCTLREAAIIGSILTKVSIPLLDSAAALLKLAEMDYSGANSLFIRVLLDKKYALPYKVVDALVLHFLRFKTDRRWNGGGSSSSSGGGGAGSTLPVLWHQSLLVFAQRYKAELVPEQKDALLELIRVRSHRSISQEVRRELVNSKCRGELIDVDMMSAV